MSLDSFKSSIARGALVFGALGGFGGCGAEQVKTPEAIPHASAEPRSPKPETNTPKIEIARPGEQAEPAPVPHSMVDKQTNALRSRIVTLMIAAILNGDKIKDTANAIQRKADRTMDYQFSQDTKRKVEICLAKIRGGTFMAKIREMADLERPIIEDLSACGAKIDAAKIKCMAGLIVKAGIGGQYADLTQQVVDNQGEATYCLDQISP